ncbi:MAG: hypothetical protein ACHP7O_08395, partial [Burkholderiales bacterium]
PSPPALQASAPESPHPNCLECKHYFISWDAEFPYGCRAINFKSKRQPQLDVLESSGQACLMFVKKHRPRER